MSRLAATFARTAAAGRAALVAFVTAGDPTTEATGPILDALVAGGADAIELGMPFTDPMADGPAIQAANIRSLAQGTRTADILATATAFRADVVHAHSPFVTGLLARRVARASGAPCTQTVPGAPGAKACRKALATSSPTASPRACAVAASTAPGSTSTTSSPPPLPSAPRASATDVA